MIGTLGWMEITIIIIIALLFVGPKKLPKMARSAGKAIRNFKKEAKELKDAVEFEIDEDERKEKAQEKKVKTADKSKKKAKEPSSEPKEKSE